MRRNIRVRKCRIFLITYLFILFTFSLTFFVRNECYLNVIRNKNYDFKEEIILNDDSIKVIDSYKLSRKERYEVAIYINSNLKEIGIHNRSIESIEAEIYLHRIAYFLNIDRNKSKDADIDYKEDKRVYVKISYLILMILGG